MNSYSYIESLFKAILSQSKTVQGRFFILPKGGYELNSDTLGQVLSDAEKDNPEVKYPLCVMVPPRSTGEYSSRNPWEDNHYTFFFLDTVYYDGNNQVKALIADTQTSGQAITKDWEAMKLSAVDFLRIMDYVQRGQDGRSAPLINNVFRLLSKTKTIVPVSFATQNRLGGVRLDFDAQINIGCEIEDYLPGGSITLPASQNGGQQTYLDVLRGEVIAIVEALGLDSGSSVPVDLKLVVNFDGQTMFNVFQTPTTKTELIINNMVYCEDDAAYSFGMNGLNPVLIWDGEFPISTSDSLIFRKY
jgi:hypothetical protein